MTELTLKTLNNHSESNEGKSYAAAIFARFEGLKQFAVEAAAPAAPVLAVA